MASVDGSIVSIYTLGLLFPIILGVHNAEEYFRHGDFISVYPVRIARFLSRRVVRTAMVLLTVAAVAIGVLTWAYRTPWLRDVLVVATFALTFNALGHVGVSLRRRALTPGTVSATWLVIPYSVAMVATLRVAERMSWWSMARLAALGLPFIPLVLAVFLALGYALSFDWRSKPA